ncbi:hypothetical protein Tco_1092565 [Tanacetum coccineum]|uniref:Uncharacterized protein n=1 Tax=Tanacetum coccineum TaxID=301880 RepID=A0ABQ5IC86_9ASTR
MTSFNKRKCVGCGQPCDGFYCYLCTCQQCGVNLINGICLNCTYGDGKPVTCCGCEGPLNGGFCSFCASRAGNSFAYDPNPNSFDDSQNLSDYPPQPQYQTYSCELCGNDAHYDYDCPPQVPFVYNQDPCFNQNFDNNFPQTSPSFPQQYLFCENYGGPHETFHCQPMNQNFYNSNSSGFEQFQPPQYPVIHHPPQETSMEMLQASKNLMKSIQTFLKKFDCISFREKPMALLLAHERFSKIKQAFREEQHQPENIQELLRKLLNDLQILNGILLERGEQAAQISTPYWKCPIFYDDDEYTIQYREYLENSSNAITPDLPTDEPDNSLSMGDEHLSTISETESDEVIKSSVEDLVLIPSESEGISDDTCDVPFCDNSPPLDVLNDHFEIFSDFNDDCTSSDDDSFENIDYVEASPPDSELVSLEEVKDDILHEKLLNINLLIAKIESLNDNPTPDCVLKSPSPFPIPVEDSDSFFEKSDTSLSYSDNSLPEFETFSDHTEETMSGSTTTHADNSLPEYDSFHFEIEPDQGELSRVVMETILGEPRVHVPNVLPTHPTLYQDSDFSPFDDSLRSDLVVSFPSRTRNKIFDPRISIKVQSERFLSLDEISNSFISDPLFPVIETLLPFLSENKDKVFNPGILASKEEKSPHSLSYRDFKVFYLINNSESPMMIYRGDIPILDAPYLHFYPP